ncbi:MAG: ferredoxin [Allosphingosinicella sp.]|uniref:ferredoxin n=1 Tax=Allosphingosinicella sp. TaxID=2823234 RepID=UPI00393AAD0F
MGSHESSDGLFRAVADRAACCGYGVCAQICPEIYKLDDAGIVLVDDAAIPAELLEAAREGAESCPQQALTLEPITA